VQSRQAIFHGLSRAALSATQPFFDPAEAGVRAGHSDLVDGLLDGVGVVRDPVARTGNSGCDKYTTAGSSRRVV